MNNDLLAEIIEDAERERTRAQTRPVMFWLRETGRAAGILAVVVLITDAVVGDPAARQSASERLYLIAALAVVLGFVSVVKVRTDFPGKHIARLFEGRGRSR